MLQASEIAPRTRSQSEDEENDVITAVKEEVIDVDSDDEKEKELLVCISASVYVGTELMVDFSRPSWSPYVIGNAQSRTTGA